RGGRRGEAGGSRRGVARDARLAEGDVLRIPPVRTAAPAPRTVVPRSATALPVLFEDDALSALEKPAGLAVHGGSGVAQGLIERLRAERPAAAFLELVHRLDRETSGVLLVAKKRGGLP